MKYALFYIEWDESGCDWVSTYEFIEKEKLLERVLNKFEDGYLYHIPQIGGTTVPLYLNIGKGLNVVIEALRDKELFDRDTVDKIEDILKFKNREQALDILISF